MTITSHGAPGWDAAMLRAAVTLILVPLLFAFTVFIP